ncbi:MAG: hypothetical protein AAF744_05900 [Pseudomonadota bacterium]
MPDQETVEVRNVNHPDVRGRVNADKYEAMKAAVFTALADGLRLTQSELREAVKPHLPEELYPGGKTAGWWVKTVQLDLEARGQMGRTASKPLTFFLA